MQAPGGANPTILNLGQNEAGKFFHILLPQIEAGVTRLLAVSGNGAVLHEIDALGNIVAKELNLPVLRSVMQAIDTLVTQ